MKGTTLRSTSEQEESIDIHVLTSSWDDLPTDPKQRINIYIPAGARQAWGAVRLTIVTKYHTRAYDATSGHSWRHGTQERRKSSAIYIVTNIMTRAMYTLQEYEPRKVCGVYLVSDSYSSPPFLYPPLGPSPRVL